MSKVDVVDGLPRLMNLYQVVKSEKSRDMLFHVIYDIIVADMVAA